MYTTRIQDLRQRFASGVTSFDRFARLISPKKECNHARRGVTVQSASNVASSGKKVSSSKAALLVVLAAGTVAFWFAHHLPIVPRCFMTLLFGAAISIGGYLKKSLSFSGALSAAFVGWLTCFASFRCGVTLVAFFVSSSLLTSLKQDIKKKLEEDFKPGGQRNWVQVAANGGVPTALAVACGVLSGVQEPLITAAAHPMVPMLMCGFMGYYACCCGDTWASEVP
ncbi:hypothetical protein CYMTET_13925 [Cymbomonas tetramitiformis]|uniref:Transmembrane protein 19 n=1 Tax=Cymbomonas tetramitiformis TaxID=36881 RepID=A0AAE0LAJ1_9CHLO|nr:hypothetical protein CYMTET_13925 [Cymbomonas tetramitiformis]